jgi:two-component system copper resistance phosphate regulon response regulator CusR
MKILIAETEKETRRFIKAGLRSECFAVDSAPDGRTGSYLARTNHYDAIILGRYLSEKNGLDICCELRGDNNCAPILILSDRKDVEDKIRLLDAGADDYLAKPFALGELLAKLRALLRRPPKIKSDIVYVEDLSVDFIRGEVRRGGREIYLTRKEYALLKYFLDNRGIALSRSMIMDCVWDMSVDPFSNTIETHILSLRKKIGRSDGKRFIRTIPGRGYIMDYFQ